ncbi:DUF5779 family protein [Haloarcula salinisoli]|uniref:Uncharacterized protein n=1 Tax=Haloarcula salinisoli TaxID=2487746 RepID=A0A8J7YD09_9EURY|nr:DUF5779 family protein [Halomicroarcula salinisoli]MBX0285250.1 hypothetical protein [Halomicroarcula salinisoli]MBX0303272.1 hypothetical protein [Halomicroarcula salinisoli]
MSDFEGLDLQAVEDQMAADEETGGSHSVVLGVLDGTTDDAEWVDAIEDDQVLVLNVDGDLNELASGFARPVKDAGGDLMHFRGFLVVTPAGVRIDKSRLDT